VLESTNQLGLNVQIALSLSGKLDQANGWFDSPHSNSLGHQAARTIAEYGQMLANSSFDQKTNESLMENSLECENMMKEFVNREFPAQMAVHLNENFNSLAFKISRTVAEQAVHAFLDTDSSIQKMYQLIKNSQSNFVNILTLLSISFTNISYDYLETPNLNENYKNLSNQFLKKSSELCEAAKQLSLSTFQLKDKHTIELIGQISTRVTLELILLN
jgi:hypothetical protein